MYSGQVFTVTSADVDANLGESVRPNRLGGGFQEAVPGAGRKGVDYPWFVLADFEKVPRCSGVDACVASPNGFLPFQFGNSGRGILEGPGTAFANLSVMKNFRRERRNAQLRLECFNILNHANFNLPNRSFNSINGGLITGVNGSGRGGPRLFQASIKFEF